MATTLTPTQAIRPSPIFFAIVAATAAAVFACATNAIDQGYAVFALVACGWILSLIFHEFAHAYVAFRGGDESVYYRGYLTLDPRRYTDPFTSLLLPMFLVLAGGIGLPGGAVWVNRRAIANPITASFMSLAGPATNLAFAVVCLVPLRVGLVEAGSTLSYGLGFLGFLQVTACVINLLPIPGLDGFGAIEPHLSPAALQMLMPVRRYGMMALFVALWFIDPVNDAFWDLVLGVFDLFGLSRRLPGDGYQLFRFWETV